MLFRPPPKVSDVLQHLTIGGSADPMEGPTGPPTSTVQNIPGGAFLESVDEREAPPFSGTATQSGHSLVSTITLDPSARGSPHFHTASANLLFINIPSYAD